MSIPLVPNLLRAHLAELAAEDRDTTAVDNSKAGMWNLRSIVYLVQKDLPGSEWEIPSSLAGVKFQIMTPYPDRPNEGGLMCSAEVRPVAGRNWEAGPPSAESIELGRVVDRGFENLVV